MGKIGLVISVVSAGKSEPFSINADASWSRMVIDLRDELKGFTGINNSNAITRLSFIDTGVLLTVISPITGREGDYKSAWIYFPSSVSMNGVEMVRVLDFTRTELNGSRINEDKLVSFFSRDYESGFSVETKSMSRTSQIAYRYYGGDTYIELHELLGNRLQQSYYRSFSAVYFIGKDSGNTVLCNGIDLTGEKVKEVFHVNPPKNDDGFLPIIGGCVFTKPIVVSEGDVISIVWQKENYKQVEKKWVASKSSPIPIVTPNEYRREVSFQSITVRDKKGMTIRDYSLRINGSPLNYGDSMYLPEADVRKCQVSVTADGFVPYKETMDLFSPISIRMENIRYSYTYKIPLYDYCEKKYGEFTIESDEPIKEVPFSGYHIEDKRKNSPGSYNIYLAPKKLKNSNKKRVLLGILLLLIAFLLGFLGGCILLDYLAPKDNNKIDAHYTSYGKDSNSEASIKNDNNERNEVEEIVFYLDNNDKWVRGEMEKFKKIEGLWDAINERRFDDIKKYKELLSSSARFSLLLKAIDEIGDKQFSSNANTKPNDEVITIGDRDNGYIKRLYDAPPAASSTHQQVPKSDSNASSQIGSEQSDW